MWQRSSSVPSLLQGVKEIAFVREHKAWLQCLPSILPKENNLARDKCVLERKAKSVYDLAELINGEIPLLLKLCYL